MSVILRALRPKQWIKNVFVLAPLVFAQQIGRMGQLAHAAGAFAIFCALSSCIYLVNDIADREADRRHPVKRLRPIASGDLKVFPASIMAIVLAVAGLAGALVIGPAFAGVACAYVFLNLAYSGGLKRVVILDVMAVAAGFLLRAWGGAVAVEVEISRWLILCTALLALFLGFVKRRQEIAALEGSTAQRPILREYSLTFLDQMISVVTASTLLAYSLYAFSPEVAEKLGTRHLGLTIPFVLYGILRYLYLVHQRGEGENPTQLVLTDAPLLVNLALWGVAVLAVLYVWR
jgi:4-hydroxybenzoate polyprenyltransferase